MVGGDVAPPGPFILPPLVIIESWHLVVTLLSKKSCVMTNVYSFWPNGKCLILIIGIRAKVRSLILGGQLLRGRLLWVAQLSYDRGQVSQVNIQE